MDYDLLQARLDYCHALGYIVYHHETKEFCLTPSAALLSLKILSMIHGLPFPRVNATNMRGVETPVLYLTDVGEKLLIKHITSMSPELFEMIAPVFKGQVNPVTFSLSDSKLYRNLLGTAGKSTRKTPKPPLKVHLLVDNSAPFEYLSPEYIYDSIYEARLFINKLVMYVPPSRMELYRVRTDVNTGRERRDVEPVLITKAPYKV